MRPISAKKHHWALLILLLVVAANTALTFLDPTISDDQANMLAEVAKQENPSEFPADEVFGPVGPAAPWRLRLPAWRALLTSAVYLAGRADPANGLRLIGAVALTAYLMSMYVLTYRQTLSVSVAALMAGMSTAIFSAGRPYWGMGPLFAVTPTTLYMAFVPLLVLGLLELRRRWVVTAVFFLAGVGGNIDLVFAADTVAVMLVVVVAAGRARAKAWALAAVGVLAATVAALPAIWHYVHAFRVAEGIVPGIPPDRLGPILASVGVHILYPRVLVETLRWLPVAGVLAAPAAIILSRAGRFRGAHLAEWLWALAAALLVAFGLHGLMQLLGSWLGKSPPFLGFFGALRLAMLPLYVLFAHATIRMLRLSRTHRIWVRAALAVFAAVFLGSCVNTQSLRRLIGSGVAALAGEPARPVWGRSDGEFLAITRWAESPANTPLDALFVTSRAELRPYARRSLLVSKADVWQIYHLAPSRLEEWAELIEEQRNVLRPRQGPPADPDAIVLFVDKYWRARDSARTDTYVLIEASYAPAPAGRLEEIPAPGGKWGNRWRLYRVAAPPTEEPPEAS